MPFPSTWPDQPLPADLGGEASYAEALALVDVAQSRAEQIGLGVVAPHLTELRGEVALRRGDHVAANAAFEQAGKSFQETGATGHVRRIAERLGGGPDF